MDGDSGKYPYTEHAGRGSVPEGTGAEAPGVMSTPPSPHKTNVHANTAHKTNGALHPMHTYHLILFHDGSECLLIAVLDGHVEAGGDGHQLRHGGEGSPCRGEDRALAVDTRMSM